MMMLQIQWGSIDRNAVDVNDDDDVGQMGTEIDAADGGDDATHCGHSQWVDRSNRGRAITQASERGRSEDAVVHHDLHRGARAGQGFHHNLVLRPRQDCHRLAVHGHHIHIHILIRIRIRAITDT